MVPRVETLSIYKSTESDKIQGLEMGLSDGSSQHIGVAKKHLVFERMVRIDHEQFNLTK